MITLFFIFVIFTVFHFFYQGIILPTIRLKIRYQLFELRDDLRKLQITREHEFDFKIFTYLQNAINNVIYLIPKIDPYSLLLVNRRIEEDDKLRKRIEKRITVVELCQLDEIIHIRKRIDFLIFCSATANTGGWQIILLPLTIFLFFWSAVKVILHRVTNIPEPEIERVIPSYA